MKQRFVVEIDWEDEEAYGHDLHGTLRHHYIVSIPLQGEIV